MANTATELAAALRIPLQRLHLVVRGRRAVTPDTALRLSRRLGGSVQFWLNLQHAVDLYDAILEASPRELARVRPLAGGSRRRAA